MFAATRVVRDADGQQIAYVYYSNDPDRRSAAKLLTKDEARRVAANIAKLPELFVWAVGHQAQKTAKTINYAVPTGLTLRADEVVE